MGAVASQITSLTIVYSTVYSDADQTNHQRSASLTFVRGIHRWPVNSPHKWPVTRKMFPFDDVIMTYFWLNPLSAVSFGKHKNTFAIFQHSSKMKRDWDLLSSKTQMPFLKDKNGYISVSCQMIKTLSHLCIGNYNVHHMKATSAQTIAIVEDSTCARDSEGDLRSPWDIRANPRTNGSSDNWSWLDLTPWVPFTNML